MTSKRSVPRVHPPFTGPSDGAGGVSGMVRTALSRRFSYPLRTPDLVTTTQALLKIVSRQAFDIFAKFDRPYG